MANIYNGTENFGISLQSIMTSDDIVPGSQASYEICKTIYLYHPFGQKIVDFPLYVVQDHVQASRDHCP